MSTDTQLEDLDHHERDDARAGTTKPEVRRSQAAAGTTADTTVGPRARKKGGRKGKEVTAPRQWIYRNLTPFRIHACFGDGGALLAREQTSDTTGKKTDHVFSVPALGEVTLPAEDASRLDTVSMRRLGQIEVRPAPSEYWTNLPHSTASAARRSRGCHGGTGSAASSTPCPVMPPRCSCSAVLWR